MTSSELSHAEVYVTWACQLNCPTCVQRKFPDRFRGMLTQEQFRHFTDRLQAQGIHLRTLEFNGGEPTLCPWITEEAKRIKAVGLVDRVICITNGLWRYPDDYDGIDLVRMTDYGAINRQDNLRLRHGLNDTWWRRWIRPRFISSWVIHLDSHVRGPAVPASEGWPAVCVSPAITLGPDALIYMCSMQCIEQRGGLPLDSPFIETLRVTDPRRQARCLNCPTNQRIFYGQYGDPHKIGLVSAIGFRGTTVLERDEKLGLACVLPIVLVMWVSPIIAIWQNPRLGQWTEGFWLYTLLFMVVPAAITCLCRDSIFLWPCLIFWLGWVLGACLFTCCNGRYGDHPEPGLMQFADLWGKGMLALMGLSFILCVVIRWRRG